MANRKSPSAKKRKSSLRSPTLKSQFNDAKNYIKQTRNYIYFSILIFLIGTLIGVIFLEDLSFLNEIIRQLLQQTENMNAPELIFFILQNNLQTAFLSTLLGIFVGIFPIFNSFANGVILGYVGALVVSVAGISSLWRLVPHGIFELPAIFIALGLGIKLGETFITHYFRHFFKKRKSMILAPIIVGVFLALLSSYITPENLDLLQQIPKTAAILFLTIGNIIYAFCWFILISMAFNKKFRSGVLPEFKSRFYKSANAFLLVVTPLLIIAAVIEGILIVFFG